MRLCTVTSIARPPAPTCTHTHPHPLPPLTPPQVRGIPRVPWEAEGIFDGISTYKLDSRGKIYEHAVDNVMLRDPPMALASPLMASINLVTGGARQQPYPGACCHLLLPPTVCSSATDCARGVPCRHQRGRGRQQPSMCTCARAFCCCCCVPLQPLLLQPATSLRTAIGANPGGCGSVHGHDHPGLGSSPRPTTRLS